MGEPHAVRLSQIICHIWVLNWYDKQQVAIEILRRTLNVEIASLTVDELTLNAEAIFLNLDQEEAEYEQQSEAGRGLAS